MGESDTTEPQGPTVSVIMIVKNGERFIAQALESIFQSKIRPEEILVIDGGSEDRTIAIARTFPLVSIIRQTSTGISNAYNEGIDRAKGALVAFLSHDDQWKPGKLDIQVAFMAQNPGMLGTVGMVQHALVPGAKIPPGFRQDMLGCPFPGMIMEALVARKAIFDAVGRFDPLFSVASDTDWFARARDAGVQIAVLPEVLLVKRVHETNASLTEPKLSHQLIRVMRNSVMRKRAMRVLSS